MLRLLLTCLAAISAILLWQNVSLAVLALTRIDPVPEIDRLIKEERYSEAQAYLDFFIIFDGYKDIPEIQKQKKEVAHLRTNWNYRLSKLWEGIRTGESDETIGVYAAVATDFLVIGDLRDLTQQMAKFMDGEETDKILVALSSMSVATSTAQLASIAGTMASGGTTVPATVATSGIKSTLTTLKLARKTGKLPPWLDSFIVSNSFSSMREIKDHIYTLTNVRGGLLLLSATKDVESLRQIAYFAEVFGPHAAVIYRLGGIKAVQLTQKTQRYGTDTVRLAATFGIDGMRVLERFGPTKFLVKVNRLESWLHNGHWWKYIFRWLADVPSWLLITLTVSGVLAWIPRQLLQRIVFRQKTTEV